MRGVDGPKEEGAAWLVRGALRDLYRGEVVRIKHIVELLACHLGGDHAEFRNLAQGDGANRSVGGHQEGG